MRAKHDFGVSRVKRILHVPRGMVRRKIQQLKVVLIRLNFTRSINLKSHFSPYCDDLPHGLIGGMNPATGWSYPRKRDIQLLVGQRSLEFTATKCFFLRCERTFQRGFHLVCLLSDIRTLIRRQVSQSFQNLPDLCRTSQVLDAPILKFPRIDYRVQLCERRLLDRIQSLQHVPAPSENKTPVLQGTGDPAVPPLLAMRALSVPATSG